MVYHCPKFFLLATAPPLGVDCEYIRALHRNGPANHLFARYEASQFGSPSIETEHLLLGPLREEKCFAAQLLREQGVSVKLVREQVR